MEVTEINVVSLKRLEEQFEANQSSSRFKNSGAYNSIVKDNHTNNNNNKNRQRTERKAKTVYPPCRTSGKTPRRNATLKPMQELEIVPWTEERKDKIRFSEEITEAMQLGMFKQWANFVSEIAMSSLWSCNWHTRDHQRSISTSPRACLAKTVGEIRGDDEF